MKNKHVAATLMMAWILMNGKTGFSEEEKGITALYGKHGLTFETEDGNFSLSAGARLQFRYTYEDLESKDDISTFEVKRAKIFSSGNIFTKNLSYKIQVNAAGDSVTLEDFYADYKLIEGLIIRAGQYKVPFNRQELTSSGSQQFVDRAITNEKYELGRDQGIMLHSYLLNNYVEYAFGIFNGNGRNKKSKENGHLYAGRIAIFPFGKFSMYSESDTDHSLLPKAGIGFAGAYNRKVPFTKDNEIYYKDVLRFTADGIFKWYGFSLVADFFFDRTEVRGDQRTSSYGLNIQAGGFIMPKHLEIAGRYTFIDPDTRRENDREKEIGGALNYFIEKHALKIQGDYTHRTIQGEEEKTERIARIQFQVIF